MGEVQNMNTIVLQISGFENTSFVIQTVDGQTGVSDGAQVYITQDSRYLTCDGVNFYLDSQPAIWTINNRSFPGQVISYGDAIKLQMDGTESTIYQYNLSS